VLEELEQMHREALGLPSVPVDKLPDKQPAIEENPTTASPEREGEERQAILA